VKKAIKISLWILTILFVLLVIAFIGGSIYVNRHQKEVIALVEAEARKGLHGGELHIGDIHIGIGHSFPRISFTMDSLYLRDSLWSRHHHDLVSAKRAYTTLLLYKLLLGKIGIARVELENPHIYLYTDTSGYTNTSLFKKEGAPKKQAPKNPDFPILDIRNGSLVIDQQDKGKFFGYDIHRLVCEIEPNPENQSLQMDIDLDCTVQRMTFNREKGPFLEGKTVVGKFQIQLGRASKVLQFEKIHLVVDQQPFVFTGKFFLADVPTPFKLSWETDHLPFRKAASFLSPNIRLKLEPYDISETITHLTGSLDNSEPEYKTPLIHLRLNVENKTVSTPVVDIGKTSFTATFNNEEIKGRGHEDSNTVMHFSPFRGRWDNLNFHSDSIVIRNLIHPRMYLPIQSDFKLEEINTLFDENELAFSRGNGKINLVYNGSLEKSYDSLRMISGNFNMDSATLIYLPRNLQFTHGRGVIRFTGKDMIVDHLSLTAGSSDLVMDGSVKSLFYLINQKNKKLKLDWSIRSNKINLNDFTSYLKQRTTVKVPKKKKSSLAQTLSEFTNLLETADIGLTLNARQLIYKKFNAENVQANLEMDDFAINMKSIKLQSAGGSITMQGNLRNDPAANPFSYKARLKNLNVQTLFSEFNNFGLKSPTDKNIRGILTADVTMQGGLTTKAQMIPDELKGFVKFNLENGELVDFEPVQKIQETVFKKRDFSDIQFADLHDLLEINGENITINRMEIRSSVITMFVEGMYNMQTGPNLSVQVPLSNIQVNKDPELKNKGINSKTGISARLRLQKGPDGKLKISWDPFNKAGKEMKAKSAKPKA
jgi:uncharacterized protein involved in outer membrane biogenesis